MFHLLGFFSSITNVPNTQINALPDQIVPIGPSNGFLIQQRQPVQWGMFTTASAVGARIITPSWRAIQIPNIRPITPSLPFPNDANVCDWRKNPLECRGLEELTMEGSSSAAGPQNAYGLVAISTGTDAPITGPVYPIACTCAGTTTASAWSDITYTPTTTMQEGTYAVIGGECVSATGIAFRLISDHTVWRPGGLCTNSLVDRAPDINYSGAMGVWCRFTSTSLPRLQVLSDLAETPTLFVMFVVRTSEYIR